MADTKLKGVIELTAKPIKVDEAASKLKDTIQEAFRAGGAGGLSDAAGSAGTHLSGISNFGKTASSGLSGAAQNLKGLLSGALGAAESGTKSGLIASAGGLIEGLGVAALGGAGMAALGMVATIGFIKSLSAASHGLQDFNFKLGGDVGSMAVVKGILGLQNTMLQLQVGNKLAPSAMKLGEANFEFKSKLENALVPAIKELNNAFASMMISMTRLIPVIGETATALAGIVAWAAKHGGNAAVGVVSGMTGGAPPSAKTSVWTQAEYGIGQGIKNLLWYGGWDEASHGAKDLWDESKKEWSGVSNAAKETAGAAGGCRRYDSNCNDWPRNIGAWRGCHDRSRRGARAGVVPQRCRRSDKGRSVWPQSLLCGACWNTGEKQCGGRVNTVRAGRVSGDQSRKRQTAFLIVQVLPDNARDYNFVLKIHAAFGLLQKLCKYIEFCCELVRAARRVKTVVPFIVVHRRGEVGRSAHNRMGQVCARHFLIDY